MLRIAQFRVTYLWCQTNPALVTSPFDSPPAPRLTTPADYAAAFEQARRWSDSAADNPDGWPGDPRHSVWALPWRVRAGVPEETVNVWRWSVGASNYHAMGAERHWRAQTPLTPSARLSVRSAIPGHRANATVLCHPLGDTVAVTVTSRGDLSAEEMVDEVAGIDISDLYVVGDDVRSPAFRMRRLGPELLRRIMALRRGESADQPSFVTDPFVVVTVVQGAGDDSDCTALEGNEVHRLLHALGNRTRMAETPPARDLAARALRGRTEQGGGVLYRLKRARVVWAPYRFRSTGRSRWLGCYHNNLVVATSLAEAWLGVVRWASDVLAEQSLPPTGFEVAQRSAALLGLVYGDGRGGQVPVYRTRSAAAQIQDSDLVTALEVVRQNVGLTRALVPEQLHYS